MKSLISIFSSFALIICLSTDAFAQGALSAVQFIDANNVAACGPNGTILRSTDAGVTWFNQSSGYTSYLSGLYFSSANVGTVVGGDPISGTQKILRTTNGGSNWGSQPNVNAQPLISVSFLDANVGFAAGYSGTVLSTTDGGSSWVSRSPSTLSNFHGVRFTDANTGTVVGDFGLILRTLNAGGSWAVQTSGTTNTLYAIQFVGSGTGTVVGSGGVILRTGDGGGSWARQTSGNSNNLNAVCFVDANNGWVVGNNGAILHTSNGGSSWSAQSAVIVHYYGVSFRDASTGIVVGSNTILRTTNGGASWTQQSVSSGSPPSAFNLVSPSNAATGQSTSGTLSWAVSTGATGYDVYLDGSNPPTTVVSSNQAGTSYAYSGLTSGGTYYWKVVARNASGSVTATGAPWSFSTTPPAPGAFSLLLPLNGAASQALTGTLSWQSSSNATQYDVYLDGNNPPTTLVSSNQTATSYSYSAPLNNATYYWKVVAKNSSGSVTATGAPWNFVTVIAAPGAFSLLSPTNAATGQALTGTLNWQTSTNAIQYDVYLDGNNPPTTIVSPNQAGTSYNFGGLANNTPYFWKVVAKNVGGTATATGSPWGFTTIVGAPAAPTLASPANGTIGQPTSFTLAWNASTGANTYRVQVATDTNFTNKIVDDSTLTGTSKPVGPLANNTKYFWHVNAKNSGGTSSYSGTWTCTTIPNFPTVTTAAASSVTSSAGTLNGSVNPNGAATNAWFEWGTSSTLATFTSTTSQAVGSGTTAAAVSAGLTGLTTNTTYFYRVAGQNSAGTQKDGILSFTTGAVLPTVTTAAASSVTSSAGTLNGSVNPNGAATNAWFEWGTSSTLATFTSTTSQAVGSGTTAAAVSSSLTGLSSNTTYYYRAAGQNSAGTQKDGILSFTTAAVLPTVTTAAASSVTSSAGTLNGSVNPNGAATSAWFEWGTSSTLATFTSTTSQAAGSGTSAVAVSSALTLLSPNTTYYYRVAGQNSAGTQKDGIVSFTTAAVLPTVTTTAASSITTSGATMNGSVNPNGAATSSWFEWGTSSTLATFTSTASQAAGSGTSAVAVNSVLTGLNANSTYFYRAVAQNSAGTQKDGILSFTTPGSVQQLPTVTTTAASSVTSGGGTLNGSVNPNGGATSAWFEWGTNSALSTFASTGSQSIGSGTTAVAVSTSLTGLSPNTTYYFRAVGQNGAGTQRDGILSFTTGAVLPTVTTTAATSITTGAGTMNGSVNPNGSGTTAWFEWGTSNTLSTFASTTSQSPGSGTTAVVMSSSLTGLTSNTTYYYRAVGQNSAGTQRDGILSFTTNAFLPTVTTTAATSVTTSGGTMNGSVNPNGASTSAWFEWGTSSTLASFASTSSQALGSGTSAVSANSPLTGLSPNTTYYYRVASQNIAGTQKDGILSFTTGAVLPAVTTTSAGSVTSSGGTMNGSVNPNNAATSAWFEWGTSNTLATFASTTSQALGSGGTAVAISSTLAGLSPNTTYYYRAAGQNIVGTQKDGILSFTTGAVVPTVTTTPASLVTTSGGTMNGSVNPNNAATSAWFEWGTGSTLSTFASTTSQAIGSGTGAVAVSSALTGLNPNTTYYYRAAGQNSAGTQKDGILSFTTNAVPPTVTTTAANAINTGGATINGTENPNGASTMGWFEWGTSSTLATFTSTTSISAGSGMSPVPVSSGLTGLSPSTTYYYRVAGQNSAGMQKDVILSFTTAVAAPSAPTLFSPSDASPGQPTTLTLTWNASIGATTYRLLVSTSPTFSSTVIDDPTLTTTSRSVTGLLNNTTYYWQVSAANTGGTSAYSGVWSFVTVTSNPVFAISTKNLIFGNVLVKTRKTDTLTVTNNGGGTLTVSNIKSSSRTFSVTPTTFSIAPGGSQNVFVSFNPTKASIYTGRLVVTSNSPEVKDTVFVSGQGVTTLAATQTINFGSVSVGSSKTDSFPIYNDGDVEVPVTSVVSTNPVFSVTPGSAIIAPFDSLWFHIVAQPDTTLQELGYIVVSYGNGLAPDSFIVRTDAVDGIQIVKGSNPREFALRQNYPNPFNPATTIQFDLPDPSVVTVVVYNVIGEEVTKLVDRQMAAGTQSVVWNGNGAGGEPLGTGIYIYRMKATSLRSGREFSQTNKMMLMK